MTIQLTLEQIQAIQTHAEAIYPEECCGLLLGHREPQRNAKQVIEVWPTENSWSPTLAIDDPSDPITSRATKAQRYWIAPAVMLQAQQQGRDRHLEVIGIYHSHPDHPAIPSAWDHYYAWPLYSYIIVAVDQGRTQDLRSWCLDDDHNFQPEAIARQPQA